MPSFFFWLWLSLLVTCCLAVSNQNSEANVGDAASIPMCFPEKGSSSTALASAWADGTNHDDEDVQLSMPEDLKSSGVVLCEGETCTAADKLSPGDDFGAGFGAGFGNRTLVRGNHVALLGGFLEIPFGYRRAIDCLNLKNGCHLLDMKEVFQCVPQVEFARMSLSLYHSVPFLGLKS